MYNPTTMRALIYVIPISIAVVIGAGGALVIQAVVNPSHDSGLLQNVANILGWGFWGALIVGSVFMARAIDDNRE